MTAPSNRSATSLVAPAFRITLGVVVGMALGLAMIAASSVV